MSADWLASFRHDPDQAIADLFSGRAGLGSSFRLDLPEFLHRAFPADLVAERQQLDGVLLSWLLTMRGDQPEQVRRLGMSTYAKRLVDALVALQLVDLPNSRNRIRSDLDAWLRWLTPLRLAPERDPALECWRLISQDQPSESNAAAWLRLAADPRPEYFNVAWVGLKLLPNERDAQRNQLLMAHAALRHAVVISHGDLGTARRSWNRRIAVLRGLFPRSPGHWHRVLDEVTEAIVTKETGFTRNLALELRPAPTKGQSRRSPRPEQPNTRVQFDRLEEDMRDDPSSDRLPRRLLDLSRRNLHFAEKTGDSYYFVRTLHNLGSQLLRLAKWEERELIELGALVENALVWEPANAYTWGLWADWFAVCDNLPAREWTLREMARLFPSNEYCRVELARLLMERDAQDWDEPVHWLRQAVEWNPDRVHSHVELARVLGVLGDRTEAIGLLKGVLGRDPSNEIAKAVLEHLGLEAPDQTADAATWSPVPVPCHSSLVRELERRGRLAGEFIAANVAGDLRGPTALIHEEAIKGDSLAGFYAQWLGLECASQRPPHAWAWTACQHWQERSADEEWEQLAAVYPEAATETRFLRLLAANGGGGGLDGHSASRRFFSNGTVPALPAASFMRDSAEQIETMDSEQREEAALAVLASGAVGSLEFVGSVGSLA